MLVRLVVNFGANDFSFRLRHNEITLEEQYFIVSEPKGEVISSKIDQVVAIYTSNVYGGLRENWKPNISLTLSQKEKSLGPKLTDWRPFKL